MLTCFKLPARLGALVPLFAGLLLAGCAALAPNLPKPGQDEAAVRSLMGEPTGRYTLPAGGQRLEYAKGPMGRETFMVDLNAAGKVTDTQQVLNERRFAQVVNGMDREELLRLIGRPGKRQPEFQNRETWYWQYPTYECLHFAVTLSPLGKVVHGGSYLPDPRCDVSQ